MADPHFDSVICLCPFDTDLTDYSNSQLSFTAYDANIVANEGPFSGTGALYVDGSQSWVGAQPPDSHLLSSGDFTVELWIKAPDNSTVYGDGLVAWHNRDNTNRAMLALFNYNNDGLIFTDNSSGFSKIDQGTDFQGNNEWNHVALTRNFNTFRLFLNGVVVTTSTQSDTILQLSSGWYLDVGRYWYSSDNNSGYFTGYISNLRITKGVARYTSAFTPPTEPFNITQPVFRVPNRVGQTAIYKTDTVDYIDVSSGTALTGLRTFSAANSDWNTDDTFPVLITKDANWIVGIGTWDNDLQRIQLTDIEDTQGTISDNDTVEIICTLTEKAIININAGVDMPL